MKGRFSVERQPQGSAASFRCIMGVPAICESRQAEADKVRCYPCQL